MLILHHRDSRSLMDRINDANIHLFFNIQGKKHFFLFFNALQRDLWPNARKMWVKNDIFG